MSAVTKATTLRLGMPSRGRQLPRAAKWRVGVLGCCVALWCVGLALGPNFVGLENVGIRICLLLWLYVPLVILYTPHIVFIPIKHMRPLSGLLLLGFTIAVIANVGVSVDPLVSSYYAMLTLAGLYLTMILWCVRENGVGLGIQIAAVLIILFYLVPALESYRAGMRLSYGRNPNSIGLIMLFAVASGLLWKPVAMKFMVIVVSMGIIVSTGSRSAMIGSLLGLAAVVCLGLRRKKAMAALTAATMLVVCVGFWDWVERNAWNPLGKVLALEDRDRGLNSGFTGRIDSWRATYEIWREYPALGSGYRTHELLLGDGTRSSSHSGYLSMLAEVGVLGAVPAFLLVAVGIWQLVQNHDNALHRTGLALSIGYCFIAVFERYYFNLGNETSVMFMFFSVAPAVLGTGGWLTAQKVVWRVVGCGKPPQDVVRVPRPTISLDTDLR